MNARTRKLVYDRDGGACWHCGTTEGLSIQHRINRQMGGSSSRDRLDNLLTFCLIGNQRMESDANFANEARDNGWKLSTWDNYASPVFDIVSKTWFTLDTKGNKTATEPPNYLI